MIKVTMTMFPRGDESKAYHLGTVEIINTGRGTESMGEYQIRLAKRGQPKDYWRVGEVNGFPRKSRGPYDLLLRSLIATVGDRQKRVVEELDAEYFASPAPGPLFEKANAEHLQKAEALLDYFLTAERLLSNLPDAGYSKRVLNISVDDECDAGGCQVDCWEVEPVDRSILILALQNYINSKQGAEE